MNLAICPSLLIRRIKTWLKRRKLSTFLFGMLINRQLTVLVRIIMLNNTSRNNRFKSISEICQNYQAFSHEPKYRENKKTVRSIYCTINQGISQERQNGRKQNPYNNRSQDLGMRSPYLSAVRPIQVHKTNVGDNPKIALEPSLILPRLSTEASHKPQDNCFKSKISKIQRLNRNKHQSFLDFLEKKKKQISVSNQRLSLITRQRHSIQND